MFLLLTKRISQVGKLEVKATFVDSLPRKWLSMNQTQRENNSIKNDSLATLYGKYNYEEAESFDWDEESVSLEDEGTTGIKAFMAIAKDEPSVGKADARSGQWVDITMKKVYRLVSMTDSDDRKHVLDYTHVDLI
nr:retrovirus-related Pol polyprotein from transposon TNT 1-94 [Tanacetum cinerariifolium]